MAETPYRTSPDHENTGWPPGVKYIVGNEACERFSYYGMRAILTVHLVALYALTGMEQTAAEAEATAAYHTFAGAVYAFPMIGAILADRLLGKFKVILWLSLMYCVGHGILAVADIPTDPNTRLTLVFAGLACIAIGAGGIKPCVSANVGDQFGRANWFRVRTIYQIFYFSINFGSFFATLLIPFIRGDGSELWRVSLAFGIPGVLMGIATFFFWLGRDKFVHVPARPGGRLGKLDALSGGLIFLAIGHLYVTGGFHWGIQAVISGAFVAAGLGVFGYRQTIEQDDGFLAIVFYNLRAKLTGEAPAKRSNASTEGGEASSAGVRALDDDGSAAATDASAPADSPLVTSPFWSKFWGPAIERFGVDAVEGPHAVFKVCTIFIFIPVFWAIFDQHGSTWILQAQSMDTTMFGIDVLPEQVSAANPLMVMGLIPIMGVLYKLCDKIGFEATPLRRLTFGMFVAGGSFAIAALIQAAIDVHFGEAVVAGLAHCKELGIEGVKTASIAAFKYPETCEVWASSEWAGKVKDVTDFAGHCASTGLDSLKQASVTATYADFPGTCEAWTESSFFKKEFYGPFPGKVSIWWQVLAYLVLTTSEVLVSITALEFAYTQAPKRMKSVVMGLFLLTVTLGNLFVSLMAGAEGLSKENFFWFFAVVAAAVGVLLGGRAWFYKQRDFTQD